MNKKQQLGFSNDKIKNLQKGSTRTKRGQNKMKIKDGGEASQKYKNQKYTMNNYITLRQQDGKPRRNDVYLIQSSVAN